MNIEISQYENDELTYEQAQTKIKQPYHSWIKAIRHRIKQQGYMDDDVNAILDGELLKQWYVNGMTPSWVATKLLALD